MDSAQSVTNDKIIREAREHLSEICRDPSKFRMCVPVHKDDSDEIFSRAFDYAETMEQNLKNVISEFTKAMNIILSLPKDLDPMYDKEALDFVNKYRNAHQDLKEGKNGKA